MSRAVMQQAFDAMSYGNTDEREAARIALREALAQQEQWTPEDTAYRPGGLAQPVRQSPHHEYDVGFSDGWNKCEARQAAKPEHPEQMARLGWQYVECPACGSEGARAFPKPEEQQSCDKQEPVAYWIPKAEQFCFASPTGRPFAKAWEPLYTSPPQPIPQAIPQIPQEQSSDGMEAVYEAIIQWDESGGKRSRRELARRIVAANIGTWSGLTSQRQPLTDIEIVEALMPVNVFGDGYHLRIARAIEAAIGIKAVA